MIINYIRFCKILGLLSLATTIGAQTLPKVTLSQQVTGTLPVANGGTGATTLTANKVLVGNGTSAVLQPTNLHWDNTNSRLGIGTNTPNEKLFVEDGTIVAEQGTDGSTGRLVAMSNNGTPLSVHARSNNTVVNIGHNTYYDGSNFVVPNTSIGKWLWGWSTQETKASSYMDFYYADTSTSIINGFLFRFTGEGNFGIGTMTPSEKLHVVGNARFTSVGSVSSGNQALYITNTGVLSTNSSDQRLKTNVIPLSSTLNNLLQIKPVQYSYYEDVYNETIGFIAQELEIYYPQLVFTNNNSGYKGIHYDKFAPILTKAIQEQQVIIQTQQQEIETLKTQIQNILTEINNLKNN